ncbi:MAG TPA: hypothetical protein VK659_05380, partial [Asanoa sp.]|nr:hypothetical protein [Asanoa sp.]
CLLTTHSAPNTTLPDEIAEHLDLFFHQSGHNVENQELAWRQPAQYLLPAQDLAEDETVRVAASPDRDLVAIYLPYAREIALTTDLAGHRFTGWDLAERAPLTPDAVHTGGRTLLRQLPTAGDQLVIAERRA